MRLYCFWLAIFLAVACAAILITGRSLHGAVMLAWLAGVMLGYALFSGESE